MTVSEIIRLLALQYGIPQWSCRSDPLSELIQAVLSQNTSDANSGRAFKSLYTTFGTWDNVARADIGDIAEAIKWGGLNRIKAQRIKGILRDVLEQRGSLNLAFLSGLPVGEAKAWLRRLHGVGPKTAGCVLLFALGRPVLPVDTHVYRVSRRLGLINSRVTVEQAHELIGRMVPPQAIYQFHVNMLAHGRSVCRARRPRCHACVLSDVCPSRYLEDKVAPGVAASA